MTLQREFGKPPRVAVWLTILFTSTGETESMLGDLLEEFSQLAAQSGATFARRWYWRQTVRTIASLIGAGFRSAPWTVLAIVLAGFLLRWYVSQLSNPRVERGIQAVLDRWLPYGSHPQGYLSVLTHGLLIERVIVNFSLGCAVAFAARGWEMTTTIALGFVGDVLAVVAIPSMFRFASRTGDYDILWTLPWSLVFSVAIIVGGATVRMRRSAKPS